jgi:hypothetical protein
MVAVVPGPYDRAAAKEVSCDILFERINKSGELPVIKIDAAKQIVHIRLPGHRCSEPIDIWTAREWQSPPPKSAKPAPTPPPPKEKTAKPSAPVETHPMFKEQAAPAQSPPTAPKPEAEETPADTGKMTAGSGCTKRLDEFWSWGEHIIEGFHYQLVGVFTVDLNGDRTTDNIGFKLTSTTMPDMVIRYFGAPGFVSARSIPSLRLPDDGVIAQLCFGQVALQEPKSKPKAKKQPRKLFEPVDLAKEMKAKQEQSEQSGSATVGSSKATLFRWLAYAGIGLFLILAGGTVTYILLRRRRGGGSGEDDDDEERDGNDAVEDEVGDEDKE